MSQIIRSPSAPTLADVDQALQGADLAPTRRRDLRSAVRRIARSFDLPPRLIPLDMTALRQRLDGAQPAGVTKKTWTTLRSNFLAAIAASGLKPVIRTAAIEMAGPWVDLVGQNDDRRIRFGLSRFARWCSKNEIAPTAVDDAVLTRFIDDVRASTIVRKADAATGIVPGLWNRLRQQRSATTLQPLTVGKQGRVSTRIALGETSRSFQADWSRYRAWATGANPFADHARQRPISATTADLHWAYVSAALTALRQHDPQAPLPDTLAELVSFERMRIYLDVRDRAAGRKANVFNFEMAKNLVAIARGYGQVSGDELARLKRLVGALKKPANRMAEKNTSLLRRFDDPALMVGLMELPARAWPTIKGEQPTVHELAKAQAALAAAILIHLPLRISNLAALRFGQTLILPRRDDRETMVVIPAEATKNREPFDGVLPPKITRLLRLYRDSFLIPTLGAEPTWLFVNPDGTAKSVGVVGQLVVTVIKRHLGLKMSAHQFRHLTCKLVLDMDPAAYETIRQINGHKSLMTTMRFYAGVDTRRAGRHYTALLEDIIDRQRADKAAAKSRGGTPTRGLEDKR